MKKILGFIVAGGFGALMVLAIHGFFIESEQASASVKTEPTPVHQPYQSVSYMPGPPVNGPDFRSAAEMTVNAVVHIQTTFKGRTSMYDDFYGQLWEYFEGTPHWERGRKVIGYGSGVIISNDGYIVTNNHVVQDASKIEVTLNDKRQFSAELIGNDPSTDLALIKIESKDLPYLKYGDSDDVKIGEWVLAVGNPFNLTSTVTAGIVSAKARDINILGGNTAIESYIQTDAAVNKGNSGGALVNTKGELVGINAAIASNTGYYEGYSFAIPANIVQKVVSDFMEFGSIQRAFIGVIIREVDAELAEENEMDDIRGVYIADLSEGGGAEDAGIKVGDVIIDIDGIGVNSLSELLEVVGQHRPGDHVEITVIRNGDFLEYDVELKNEFGTVEVLKEEKAFFSEILEAQLGQVTTEEKNQLGINHGLKVLSVDDGGLLNRGDIKEGFIITSINGQSVRSKSNVEFAIKNTRNNMVRIEGVYPNGMRVVYSFSL
ncbi:MAG: trypsin-like peptidase domain-containing protein [Bacteroidales bacterium]|nr:trypsin-like peptidase domain-containing protein [Bacteroidales bacterium]MCF8352094.1 trypsin-like peptidase domain-containing protein [Bacteroidales bacterium]MCF8375364.1 trypsin-like peptidase domain-containing protein [Bacteroidales bacterium]MCF8400220.1 trypsin-like peptidase domain-containing protein [Bacteroidales bacterium]